MAHYEFYGWPVESQEDLEMPVAKKTKSALPPIIVSIERLTGLSHFDELAVDISDQNFARMAVPGFGEFNFDRAQSALTIRASESLTSREVVTATLNQAIPFALSVLGELILHAAAVISPRGAVLFMGRRGVGKSHLAAMAIREGFKILADDFVRIVDGPVIRALPSFPEVRLFGADASRFIGLGRDGGTSGLKTCLRVEDNFAREAIQVFEIVNVVRNSSLAGMPAPTPSQKFEAIMDNCLFYPTLTPQDTQRRLNLIARLCTSEAIRFKRLDLADGFAKDLNQMSDCFNL